MTSVLSPAEESRLVALCARDPFANDVWAHVSRILGSPVFARTQQRAQGFLSWIAAKTLLGESGTIKETTIAVAVFGEPADFNTAESAKVRVAGADLRRRLNRYRALAGEESVEIRLPLKTYVPEIVDHRFTIEVARLQNWSASDQEAYVCGAFIEELRYRLSAADFRVSIGPTLRLGFNRRVIVVRGGCGVVGERFQVSLSAADSTSGDVLWSKTLDESRDQVFMAARAMAEALISASGADPKSRSDVLALSVGAHSYP